MAMSNSIHLPTREGTKFVKPVTGTRQALHHASRTPAVAELDVATFGPTALAQPFPENR
jgi:hypothetical protein